MGNTHSHHAGGNQSYPQGGSQSHPQGGNQSSQQGNTQSSEQPSTEVEINPALANVLVGLMNITKPTSVRTSNTTFSNLTATDVFALRHENHIVVPHPDKDVITPRFFEGDEILAVNEPPKIDQEFTQEELLEYKRELHRLYRTGLNRKQYQWSGHELTVPPPCFVSEYEDPRDHKMKAFKLLDHQLDGIGFATHLYNIGRGGCCLLDSPGAGKTLQGIGLLMNVKKIEKQAHLIIVPAALYQKWKDDFGTFIKKKYPGSKVLWYRKSSIGQISQAKMQEYDIVVMSYKALEKENAKYEKWIRDQRARSLPLKDRRSQAIHNVEVPPVAMGETQKTEVFPGDKDAEPRLEWPLLQMKWNVVLMDEAHTARNRENKLHRLLTQLQSKFNVAITGTPIQNQYSDIGALFALIKLKPLSDRVLFERFFVKGFYAEYTTVKQQWSHLQNRFAILGVILNGVSIQRLKNKKFMNKKIIPVKPHRVQDIPVQLDKEPIRLNKWWAKGRSDLEPWIIAEADTQLATRKMWDDNYGDLELDDVRKAALASLDGKSPQKKFKYIQRALWALGHPAIPYASEAIFKSKDDDDERDADEEDAPVNDQFYEEWLESMEQGVRWKDSSKIRAAVTRTADLLAKAVPPSGWKSKVLIFSPSTRINDVAYIGLTKTLRDDQVVEKLDGRIPVEDRKHIIKRFQDNGSDTMVLICSTKAACEGIDLTAAKSVILINPDWNPANDLQAISRACRLGQKKIVEVYRIVAGESMDQRVHEKQVMKLEKAHYFDGSLDLEEHPDLESFDEFLVAFDDLVRLET